MSNVKTKMDITFDHNGPSIVVEIAQYFEGYKDVLARGGTIRCITEITSDNIEECKKLQSLVTELRHLDGMKGGIAINDSEYMATAVLKTGKPFTEVIYSNVDEVVVQGQYIFDTLWKNAIPASKRITEIEGGRRLEYETKILSKSDGTLNMDMLVNFLYGSKEMYGVVSTGGLQMSHSFFLEMLRDLLQKKEMGLHKGIKTLIEITRDNAELVDKFLKMGLEIRHLTNKPNVYFSVTDSHLIASIERTTGEDIAGSVIYSNDPSYLAHFRSLFDRLWTDGEPAEKIINLIQKEQEIPFIETITSPEKTFSLVKELIASAKEEFLAILPTYESLCRQVEAGVFDHIEQSSHGKTLTIRIIVTEAIDFENGKIKPPFGNGSYNLTLVSKNGGGQNQSGRVQDFTMDGMQNITIRFIHSTSMISEMGLVIADRSKSLVVEPRENISGRSIDHIGLASYSNSPQISRSYASIFDTIWNQADLYNHLKNAHHRLEAHDRMQREFIDIVAHELRTPLQSMLGLIQHVNDNLKEKKNKDMLGLVTEGGRKLHNLIENILTATKLEGNSSDIPKETFDLVTVILDVVSDYQTRLENMQKLLMPNTKKIRFEMDGTDRKYMIKGNKLQITMVVSNIIDNAINFISQIKESIITITIEHKENDVLVHIKDNGDGIDPEILSRLFTKFATKSFYGTGLGLYTCKKVIEAHRGIIWAQNNSPDEGGGATFSFSVPLVTTQV